VPVTEYCATDPVLNSNPATSPFVH
jgi:hypothetical protein